MTNGAPNAFVQTPVDQSGEKTIMKIRCQLVNILLETSPEIYEPYVVYEGKKRHKVLYVQVLMALYGMIVALLLHYKKFKKGIESIGFEANPYDVCIANRIVNGKQHTVTNPMDSMPLFNFL